MTSFIQNSILGCPKILFTLNVYEHLLLHCPIASELWSMLLGLFGGSWVMPRCVSDLLACWIGKFARHGNIEFWRVVPHCLMRCLWRL